MDAADQDLPEAAVQHVSQMLTLYTTPVVYLYLDRFSLWTDKWYARFFRR